MLSFVLLSQIMAKESENMCKTAVAGNVQIAKRLNVYLKALPKKKKKKTAMAKRKQGEPGATTTAAEKPLDSQVTRAGAGPRERAGRRSSCCHCPVAGIPRVISQCALAASPKARAGRKSRETISQGLSTLGSDRFPACWFQGPTPVCTPTFLERRKSEAAAMEDDDKDNEIVFRQPVLDVKEEKQETQTPARSGKKRRRKGDL